MKCYAIKFKKHIHVDYYCRMSVFNKRKHAELWLKDRGIPGCKIVKIEMKVIK